MRALLGCAVGLVLWGCGSGGGPSAILDTDKSEMRAALDSFTVQVVQHRDSTAAAHYVDNATLMPPNHAMVQGRAAIREFIKTLPPLRHFVASPIEINGRGDLAYVRGTYQNEFVSGATDAGKFLEVRRRQADGRWLIVADMFNSDLPAK